MIFTGIPGQDTSTETVPPHGSTDHPCSRDSVYGGFHE